MLTSPCSLDRDTRLRLGAFGQDAGHLAFLASCVVAYSRYQHHDLDSLKADFFSKRVSQLSRDDQGDRVLCTPHAILLAMA